MLKHVRRLNWDGAAYAPRAEDAVINTEQIVSVVIDDRTRRMEPCVKITMVDGSTMQCLGTPEDFLAARDD